jgi:hypothetical protein
MGEAEMDRDSNLPSHVMKREVVKKNEKTKMPTEINAEARKEQMSLIIKKEHLCFGCVNYQLSPQAWEQPDYIMMDTNVHKIFIVDEAD